MMDGKGLINDELINNDLYMKQTVTSLQGDATSMSNFNVWLNSWFGFLINAENSVKP